MLDFNPSLNLPLRRPAVQPGDPRFPGLDAGGTESTRAGRGRRRRPERGVRVGVEGTGGKGRGEEAEGGGNGSGCFSFPYPFQVRRRATRILGTRCEGVRERVLFVFLSFFFTFFFSFVIFLGALNFYLLGKGQGGGQGDPQRAACGRWTGYGCVS